MCVHVCVREREERGRRKRKGGGEPGKREERESSSRSYVRAVWGELAPLALEHVLLLYI